ncbi:hypothetical protein DSO57_1000084 [Entomophthora muscae]|uniref:Uncharacterized protein n=1 Tax=Entomophthora muscae TaxID=34485 RepID=A0ACC2SM95_9FUNG|nr:hypothetical protein DSO57_1000084 [Entomophthora muscae]
MITRKSITCFTGCLLAQIYPTTPSSLSIYLFLQGQTSLDPPYLMRNIICSIAVSHHQKPGEGAITDILNQIVGQYQSTAYNAVLSCFDVAVVPDVYDSFAIGLLETMDNKNLSPTSDSFGVILGRLLTRFATFGPLKEKRLSKAMHLYKMMDSSGLTLRQSISLSLCSALCKMVASKPQFRSDLVQVTCDIIENRYVINHELGCSILLALTKSVEIFPSSYLSHYLRTPTKVWDYNATIALWEALKSSTPDVEETFYVILHCFSVVARNSHTIDSSLKELFHHFTAEHPPASTRPFGHLVAAISRELNIDYILDLLGQHGIAPDADVLNAILHYYTSIGYPSEALDCFQSLLAGPKKVNGFLPNGETLALAFHASCESQDFVQSEEFCKAYFSIVSTTPRSLKEYISLLNGFTSILKIKSGSPSYIFKRADWAVRKAYYLLRQTQMANYRGPSTHLYACIIKIYSLHVQGVGKDHSASKAYGALMEKFNELIVDNSLKVNPVVYANIFQGVSNIIRLRAVKQSKAIADLDRILHYMEDMHVKLNPQIFLSLFLVFKAAKLPQRVETTFLKFVALAKADDLSDRDYAAAAINMYIATRPLRHKEVSELLQTMDELDIYPDEHTFIQLLKSLARQKATLGEFRSCIRLVNKYMTPRNLGASAGQLEISAKLLGTVANSFSFLFGASEMTKAVSHLLSIAEASNRLRQVPVDLFVHLVGLSLKPSRHNRGEEAFLWLERLSKLPRSDQTLLALQSALTLIDNANPALSAHLSDPNFKWRIDLIRRSIEH